jgi:hypothetical protein
MSLSFGLGDLQLAKSTAFFACEIVLLHSNKRYDNCLIIKTHHLCFDFISKLCTYTLPLPVYVVRDFDMKFRGENQKPSFC